MTAPETDRLAELIERKCACLIRLRDMGDKQLTLVRRGEIAELLDVLAAKQRFLMELRQIERALDPFREQPPDSRHWRAPEDRQKCAEQLAQCETLLGQIITQEKQSEGELTRRRDDAAARLQGTHVASRARKAYTSRSQPEANQLDLLSEG